MASSVKNKTRFAKKKNDVFSVYDNWKTVSLHKKVLKNLSNDYTCIPETALSCYLVLRTKCRYVMLYLQTGLKRP